MKEKKGARRIASITRYVTVALGLIQGTAYFFYLRRQWHYRVSTMALEAWFSAIVIIFVFTAGTALMMWLGEQINVRGCGQWYFDSAVCQHYRPYADNLGSGYGIISTTVFAEPSAYGKYLFLAPFWLILFLAVIWVIVFMNDSERRLPVQYAKRVVGRKVYGGQSSHIPIKVAMSGVMPIIFACFDPVDPLA